MRHMSYEVLTSDNSLEAFSRGYLTSDQALQMPYHRLKCFTSDNSLKAFSRGYLTSDQALQMSYDRLQLFTSDNSFSILSPFPITVVKAIINLPDNIFQFLMSDDGVWLLDRHAFNIADVLKNTERFTSAKKNMATYKQKKQLILKSLDINPQQRDIRDIKELFTALFPPSSYTRLIKAITTECARLNEKRNLSCTQKSHLLSETANKKIGELHTDFLKTDEEKATALLAEITPILNAHRNRFSSGNTTAYNNVTDVMKKAGVIPTEKSGDPAPRNISNSLSSLPQDEKIATSSRSKIRFFEGPTVTTQELPESKENDQNPVSCATM